MLETCSLAVVGPPRIDFWLILGVIVRVLHITFATILVGGIAYRRIALADNPLDRSDDESMRRPWAIWIGIASGILLVTGLYNTWLYLLSGQYEKLHFTYHAMWGVKFLLALALMFLAALLAGRTKLARRLQRREVRWLNVALLLAVLIFTVGAMMRTYTKYPPPKTFVEQSDSQLKT